MNGSAGKQTAAFDNIRLSLDRATLDAALGKRKVQAIDVNGQLLYDEEKITTDRLTEQLERVWNEYPNGLLDINEERLEKLSSDEHAVKKEESKEDQETERDPSKMMSRGEMDELRTEVHEQLNAARNELWFVLELAKTLSVSSSFTHQPPPPPSQQPDAGPKKGKQRPAKANEADVNTASGLSTSVPQEPPVLPPGTFSITPSTQPTKPPHTQVHELELILKSKQQALDECSALIDSAVSELQMMASAGDRFWRDIKSLKDGQNGRDQWAILPKPDFGRTMVEGEKSKDIIIPYSVDEAPRATRSRCLAAFDLDPTKEDDLTFGSRSHLRLRTTLKDVSGAVVGSSPVIVGNSSGVRAQMEAAQMEAFDEDLFSVLRYEASQISKSELEPKSVSFPAAEYTLSFELYDTRTRSQIPTSPLCDLIVSSAQSNLLNLHRHRKSRLVSPMSSSTASPTLLKPIVHALRYRQLCNTINSTLSNFASIFETAGLEASSTCQMIAGQSSSEAISEFLVGRSDTSKLSGTYRLDIPGCRGVKIDAHAPFRTSVTLTNATFDLSNPEELSHILSEEFATQILTLLRSELRNRISDASIRSRLFLDELEGMIHLSQIGLIRQPELAILNEMADD
ncbi:hypothetical protein L486_02781 [Kwoniella mangroviensis CBS 10435]|uniref:Mediator of RNA polymerase II transcription subunit 17 n=1 Tax=Kwoniella mangroviensis CBS 10435 TaxID=1331196 RepID=A0A1B9IXF0_9TREE|nr:hypothetical protein L486_02781 [Kwoniella mangroviensis CBS 10435]